MPRFYLDVHEGGRLVPHDEDGFEFANVDVAEGEAALAAAEIARNLLPSGKGGEIKVEVRDARGQRVLTVTMFMAIKRDPGASQPHVRRL